MDETERRFVPRGKTSQEDLAVVMKHFGLPKRFPAEVLEEARTASKEKVTLKKGEKRLDLRKKFIFTCDPESAKDYDDALSLWSDRKGNRVLGVHIADVSHYVKAGSALDREAFRRSTSTYFPGKVVPMLPEELSDGLCSLVPGEDRFAFSVFITYDKNGEPVKREFAKSIINSKVRFTYEQVMGVITSSRFEARRLKLKAGEWKTVREIHSLAQQLRAKRFAAGALDIETSENELILDGEGMMTGLVERPYDESHQMIEECMVAANEAVAKELWTKGIRILARYHGAPDPEKLLMLREELRPLGVKCGNLENPKVFSQFMQSVKRHPAYSTIAVMVLRSMKRALYDGANMGHWGLAKKYYAHFTSPIRRYPDLTLHRQLAAYLEAKEKGSNPCAGCKIPPKTLERWAMHTSEMEERSAEAERAFTEIKKYRLLEEELASRIRVEYDGTITKCARIGCFVEIPTIGVSGLVHVSRLSSRYVRFNESDHTLSSPGGGSWKCGDALKVVVERVDFAERHIDLAPATRAGNNRKKGRRQWN